jgi:hypothetical protein
MAQMSTQASVQVTQAQRPWVIEAILAALASAMVAVAVVVWWRIHSRVQECVGGCPDLEAVTDAIPYNGWSVIGLSAVGIVMAGFSLRKTRGTDAIRAIGALALIGGVAAIVLGALLLNTSL